MVLDRCSVTVGRELQTEARFNFQRMRVTLSSQTKSLQGEYQKPWESPEIRSTSAQVRVFQTLSWTIVTGKRGMYLA